jgi:CRISPR-associated protein Csb3
MTAPETTFHVNVDPANPGQFFACCGLLELADRLHPGAEGWFEEGRFVVRGGGTLGELMTAVHEAEFGYDEAGAENAAEDDEEHGPPAMRVGRPIRSLRLDWWQDTVAGGRELKVWAGSMDCLRIAKAMQAALGAPECRAPGLLDFGLITYDPENPVKKTEPFYFDARRCSSAHSRDVGFAANDLQLTTTTHPAVEFLCLIGLQRIRPRPTTRRRIFDYFTWTEPRAPEIAAAAAMGIGRDSRRRGFRFECWFRTGQKKHKAFRTATILEREGETNDEA